MVASTFSKRPLSKMVAFFNGKSIKPGGSGKYPVYGANGIIGGSDVSKYS